MEFQLPTRSVVLPICGEVAVVRMATLKAQKLLFEQEVQAEGMAQYLAACTVSIGAKKQIDEEHILSLKVPDQEVLGVEIYRATKGDRLLLSGDCEHCGNPAGYAINLAELELRPMIEPTWTVKLPLLGHVLTCGYPDGRDELNYARHRLQSGSEGIDLPRRAAMCIRKVDGSDKVRISDIGEWPVPDHEVFMEAAEEHECGYQILVSFRHKCGKRLVMNLLTDPSCLFPNLVGRQRRLIGDSSSPEKTSDNRSSMSANTTISDETT